MRSSLGNARPSGFAIAFAANEQDTGAVRVTTRASSARMSLEVFISGAFQLRTLLVRLPQTRRRRKNIARDDKRNVEGKPATDRRSGSPHAAEAMHVDGPVPPASAGRSRQNASHAIDRRRLPSGWKPAGWYLMVSISFAAMSRRSPW